MRLISAGIALATGCIRNTEYEGGVGGDDSAEPVETVECGDDSLYDVGFRIEGTTLDLGTGAAITAAGMCVTAIDPAPAVAGGNPTILASSTVCDNGDFVVAGITQNPTIGMFVNIDDCEGSGEDLYMLTATGIKPADIAELGDGDALEGVDALGMSFEYLATYQADLEALGYEGSLATDGYMAGFVRDSSGEPVGGATVACPTCSVVYYQDADTEDGVFSAGATTNTQTDADAGAGFLIPKASITTYSASDGGSHEWESTLLGSLPAYAVYTNFIAL